MNECHHGSVNKTQTLRMHREHTCTLSLFPATASKQLSNEQQAGCWTFHQINEGLILWSQARCSSKKDHRLTTLIFTLPDNISCPSLTPALAFSSCPNLFLPLIDLAADRPEFGGPFFGCAYWTTRSLASSGSPPPLRHSDLVCDCLVVASSRLVKQLERLILTHYFIVPPHTEHLFFHYLRLCGFTPSSRPRQHNMIFHHDALRFRYDCFDFFGESVEKYQKTLSAQVKTINE